MTKTYLVHVLYRYDGNEDMALRDTLKEAVEFTEEAMAKDATVYLSKIFELDTRTKEIKELRDYNDGRGLVEV